MNKNNEPCHLTAEQIPATKNMRKIPQRVIEHIPLSYNYYLSFESLKRMLSFSAYWFVNSSRGVAMP